MISNVLKNIGLTEKEAAVYLALLELGSSPVSTISHQAKINRVTTYDILKKLIQKGLVNFLRRKDIKYFAATKPDIVYQEYKTKLTSFKNALPALKRLSGQTPHPRVRYFEGLEGIKNIYTDTLSSKTEILNYSNSKEIRDNWPEYDSEYVTRRVKKKIFLRGISPLDDYGLKVQTEDQKYLREIRLVPAKDFSFTNEINIYDNKVAIVSYRNELIGMIIESIEIANTQRDIFKMAWEFTKKYKK